MLGRLLGVAPDDIVVDLIQPSHSQPVEAIAAADVVVSYLAQRARPEALEAVVSHPAHVRIETGLWAEPGNSEWRKALSERAVATLYDSPMHQRLYAERWGVAPSNPYVLPCPIPVAEIRAHALDPRERDLGIVWAGEWSVDKGADLAMRWAADHRLGVDFYSPSMDVANQVPAQFCNFKGFVPEADWYPTLARYSKLIHFPRVPEPFPYIVMEAFALGLQVEMTGRVGIESYDCDMVELLDRCDRAAGEFWDIVRSAK